MDLSLGHIIWFLSTLRPQTPVFGRRSAGRYRWTRIGESGRPSLLAVSRDPSKRLVPKRPQVVHYSFEHTGIPFPANVLRKVATSVRLAHDSFEVKYAVDTAMRNTSQRKLE